MCVQIAAKKGRPGTSQLITGMTLSLLAPQSLTTQVPDQRLFTGTTPEWSDCEVPALVGITGQVLGLPFLAAI